MAWSSRLRPGDSRSTRAIPTRHTWQFVNKRPDADSFDGVSRWFCSRYGAETIAANQFTRDELIAEAEQLEAEALDGRPL